VGRRSTPNGSFASAAGAGVVVLTMFCVAVIGRAWADNNRQDTVRTTAIRVRGVVMSMVMFFLSQSFFVLFPRKLEKQLFRFFVGRV